MENKTFNSIHKTESKHFSRIRLDVQLQADIWLWTPGSPNALITVLGLTASWEKKLGKMAQHKLLGCKSWATSHVCISVDFSISTSFYGLIRIEQVSRG